MVEADKYKEAGVDLEKASLLVEIVKKHSKSLPQKGVLSGIGGYAGFFSLEALNLTNPVLVSSTDGVGTKIKVAIMAGAHRSIGIDLVAMCVNDIITCGAKPLFFLDYLAFGRFEEKVFEELISGIVEGCKLSECALLGGETAEMPGMYAEGDYDCAGFVVGIVERDKIIDGSEVSIGDVLVGIESSGVHSNGFSLIRKIFFEEKGYSIDHYFEELEKTLAEELLTPTKIYVTSIRTLISRKIKIKACAHITGGGFFDNLPRVIPQNCKAVIEKSSWEWKPIFKLIKELGKVSEEEMYRVFNCGIGFVLVVSEDELEDVKALLKALGEKFYIIGHIEKRKSGEPRVILI